jgi:hypothetical protein
MRLRVGLQFKGFKADHSIPKTAARTEKKRSAICEKEMRRAEEMPYKEEVNQRSAHYIRQTLI